MKICQYIILVMLVVGLLRGLYTDFYGVKERAPYGYSGAIITIVLIALFGLCYWKAGAFSEIFP